MSDSFDTPFSLSESSSLVSDIVKPLTIRKKVEELQVRASDNTNPWSPERRNIDPKKGLDTFSGLFVYVCLSFIPTHLIRKRECRPDYPDGWYHADGRRITISHSSAFAEFFLDGTPRKRDTSDDLTDTGVKLYTAMVQKVHPSPSERWLAALGLLLAFDEGRGDGGKLFHKGKELDREELEQEASSLTVQYNGQTCSRSFVESVLEIYAKNVCGAILSKKEPCPHCGEQKVEKKPCPHCGITGDSWTCPSCGTKTAVADIPKHGTGGMYCPNCGIPVAGAEKFLARYRAALRLPPDKGLEELKNLQLEYTAIVGFEKSWSDLNEQIRQLDAAKTTLEKIADAITRKNITEAQKLLDAARGGFPGLDYSQFERQIADLEAEEERRKQQKRALDAANEAIQSAINAEKYNVARNKVNETAAKNLPGFNASEWRLKIDQAEEKKKAEKLADDRKKAREQYEAALNDGRWDDAARWAHERERLDDGKFETYKAEIDQWKAKRREKLEEACTKAIDDFKQNFPANLDAAEAALNRAETAVKALEKEFSGSSRISSTKNDIRTGRSDIVQKRRDNIVNDLRPVQTLTASGSTDGKPTVTVAWKPGVGGTQVAKWRLTRRGRNQPFPDIDGTATRFEDKGSDLKLGAEYIYEIAPVAEITNASGKVEFRPNDKAKTQSAPAVCLAPVDKVTGSGEGFPGGDASVELSWSMPSQLSAESVKIEIIRTPQFSSTQKSVTLAGSFSSWSDMNVRIGESYDYSIALVAGVSRTVPAKSGRISVKQASPPPPPGNVKARRSGDGEFIIEWDWCGTETGAIVSVRSKGATTAVDRPPIERLAGESQGRITYYLQSNGSAEVTLKAYRMIGGKRLLGEASQPVSFGEAVEVECSLECQRGWFRKPALLRVESASGVLPPLSVRIGDPEPIFPDDGDDLGSPVPVPGKPGEAALTINASKRGYVHVFLRPPASSADWIVLQPENNHL